MDNTNLPRATHTLVIVRSGPKILLGYKKRGNGFGKWNSFGGKVEKGETVEFSALRELKEECGLQCEQGKLTKVATIDFAWLDQRPQSFVHVFQAENCDGEIIESEEMRPRWFPITEIPYQKMWHSDSIWLPMVLDNKRFRGHFLYNNENVIVDEKLNIIKDGEEF